jgi:hypothetical protein
MFNKAGTLILHNRAIFPTGCCGKQYKHGPPIIQAMRDALVVMFGEAETDQAIVDVLAGRDATVHPPEWVRQSMRREAVWEKANEPPKPRSECVEASDDSVA